jgi:hypothetical protein
MSMPTELWLVRLERDALEVSSAHSTDDAHAPCAPTVLSKCMGKRWALVLGLLALMSAAQEVAHPLADLAPLGVVEFEPASWAERGRGTAHIDVRGRLWWSEAGTSRLHVYDERGTLLFTAQIEPAKAPRTSLWFQDVPEGLRIGAGPHVATFDLEGRQRATRAFWGRGRRDWLLEPEVHGDDLRWELGEEDLWFRVPRGPAREVARAAPGCSFGPVRMGRDGSMVLCEQSTHSDPGAPRPRFLRFRADGEPDSAFSLGRDVRVLDFVEAERLTLLVDPGGRLCGFAPLVPELWQLDSEGTLLSVRRLPSAPEASQIFRAPITPELWVFCPALARLVRVPLELR